MTVEEYPEDVDIKKTNFKTDQQEEAAETIAEAWPTDLDTIAEEGQHVKIFYSQVLDQFLGPAEAEMTFGEIESEYGSVEQWADGDKPDGDDADDIEVPDVEDIGPDGGDTDDGPDTDSVTARESADSTVDASADIDIDAAALSEDGDGEAVDARRRAWFRAGFREGVEFARENPDLFGDR